MVANVNNPELARVLTAANIGDMGKKAPSLFPQLSATEEFRQKLERSAKLGRDF